MTRRAPVAFVILIIFLSGISLLGILTGIIGYSWWKKSFPIKDLFNRESIEIGLWKECVTYTTNGDDICRNRERILKFDDSDPCKIVFLSCLILVPVTCFFLELLVRLRQLKLRANKYADE